MLHFTKNLWNTPQSGKWQGNKKSQLRRRYVKNVGNHFAEKQLKNCLAELQKCFDEITTTFKFLPGVAV
jgi:hypothetical protein